MELKIRSYAINHGYQLEQFLRDYRQMLRDAISEIWDRIRWIEKYQRNHYLINQAEIKIWKPYLVKRLIPILPKSNQFKRQLRNRLLQTWEYAAHYVDSAIKTAYSILNSWRRNYVKGERKRLKPLVKRLFARVKQTLYVYRNGKIRITIKPRQYLEFDVSNAWFKHRVQGWDLGELILKPNEIVISFKKQIREQQPMGIIGWDSNLVSLDGYNPKLGWIRIDLRNLYHIHRCYEIKRQRLQSLISKKPSLGKLMGKYSARETNRVRDFIHKLTNWISNHFKGFIHVFEDLDKRAMITRSRNFNRMIQKQNWRSIARMLEYKSKVILVDPRNTSRTCSRCGGSMQLRKGQVHCPECGLTLDRQLNAAMNIFKCGAHGFTPKGDESYDLLDELMRAGSLMIPKVYVCPYGTT